MADDFKLDPRLSKLEASVLRNRKTSPLRFSVAALELAIIRLSAVTSVSGRALSLEERRIVADVFGSSVNAERVRITEARILNSPTVLGNQIRVAPGWDFAGPRRTVLVHEFMHIWQYQTQGTRYISDSVYHNVRGYLGTGTRNVAYMNYQLRADSKISDFSAEEQATIVGDYFEITRIYGGATNAPPWIVLRSPDLPIYERLMEQVRSARPRV